MRSSGRPPQRVAHQRQRLRARASRSRCRPASVSSRPMNRMLLADSQPRSNTCIDGGSAACISRTDLRFAAADLGPHGAFVVVVGACPRRRSRRWCACSLRTGRSRATIRHMLMQGDGTGVCSSADSWSAGFLRSCRASLSLKRAGSITKRSWMPSQMRSTSSQASTLKRTRRPSTSMHFAFHVQGHAGRRRRQVLEADHGAQALFVRPVHVGHHAVHAGKFHHADHVAGSEHVRHVEAEWRIVVELRHGGALRYRVMPLEADAGLKCWTHGAQITASGRIALDRSS